MDDILTRTLLVRALAGGKNICGEGLDRSEGLAETRYLSARCKGQT